MQASPQQQTGESQSIDVHLDLSQVNQTDGASCVDASSVDQAPVVQPSDEEVIASLAAMSPVEYDRVRTEKAKQLGIQLKTLDAMVKQARNQEAEPSNMPFPEVVPHPEPINPAMVLNEVADTIQRFIVLGHEQVHALTLWIALTWFIDVVDIFPLLLPNSPEKGCGKTNLLTVAIRLVCRALPASNASASALFRAVELWRPTILIDEADTFFKDHTDLHGMVNAGYLRDGYVLRSEAVGDSFEPRMFSVYSAKALAGIALEKHLPDATLSRGIMINMRRKLPHESVERLRHADKDLFAELSGKLARFAADYSEQVRKARPVLPEELSDRDQDNWDGLLALASCAGDEWLARATAAAIYLSCENKSSVSTGNELLADIQHIFERRGGGKISTVQLIEALCADEESGWATYNRGKPLSPRQLAKQLATYGINSKTVRLGPGNTPKGFDADQFADVFARYLAPPEKLPQQRNDTQEALNCMSSGVADKTQHSRHDDATGGVAANPQQNSIRNDSATPEPLTYMDCGGVAAEIESLAGSQCRPVDAYPDSAF